jgi:uncharacterized protein YcbK (DUF882 family)
MQNDDMLRDPVANRRRFLKVLALGGLAVASVGSLLSTAAEAAIRAKKTGQTRKALRGRTSAVSRRKREQPRRDRHDWHDQYEVAKFDRSQFDERTISLAVPNMGEKLVEVPFWADGTYQSDAIREISYIMRDWRTGEVHQVEPELLDLLFDLRRTLGTSEPFQVVCGYRSPETNAMLVERGHRGVAPHSLHMQGRAIDIRLDRRGAQYIQRAALSLGRGGVGYYPRMGFVHVDTGPVRQWRG